MPSYVRSGSEISVNTTTAGDQQRSSITKLSDGSLVVVWQSSSTTHDGNGGAVLMRRYSAAGVALGSETLVNAAVAGDQIKPQVTALTGGGYVVTWETSDTTQDGNGTAIKGQVFSASGAAVGAEFRANTLTTANQQQPTIAGLADGSFVIAWQTTDTTQDGSGSAIKAQRFGATGTLLGSEFRVNTTATGSQINADIAILNDGRFVVSWQDGASGSSMSHAQVYNADGTVSGAQINIGFGAGEFDTAVAALSDGGFVMAYHRLGSIFFQRYDVNRVAVGGEVSVGSGTIPEVSALTEGGFVVSWRQDSFTLSARAFSAAGAPTGSEFLLAQNGSYASAETSIVSLIGGGFAATWTDGFSSSGAGQEVKLGIFQPVANTAPELGAPTRSVSVAENLTAVTTIVATDDGGPSPVTYSIFGGADAARFTINATTGALSFVSAPNFEVPTDVGANNVYDVIVRASDGELADTQAIAISVTNVNEAPVITSDGAGASAAFSVNENALVATNVLATDVDSANLTYTISGGLDAALFTINATTGVLTFVTAPDFESPADNGANNIYNVTVRASDGVLSDTQALTITILNVNEPVVITSNGAGASAALSVAENTSAVTTVTSTDPENTPRTYAIAGGVDAAFFTINASTGALSFVGAPNFEAPSDAGANNVYDVIVSASDGVNIDTQALAVTVTNTNEGLAFTSGTAFGATENATAVGTVSATDIDGDAVTYAIAGGADAALFAINASTGAISFVSAPNFEAPGDAGGNNVYDVVISATDGNFSATSTIAVTVGNANEGVSITSASIFARAENGTSVATITATDIDGDAITYSIDGGADAALFAIDAVTGALSFVGAPNFEAPNDAGGNNVYDVIVRASDGSFSDARAVAVTVTNTNEGLAFTSGSAFGATENGTSVGTVSATDIDGDAVTYAIAGGADAALFAINATTGAISFVSAPNFEAPGDVGGNNVYDVVISATDGSFSATSAIAVTVGNANEGVSITSASNFTRAENGTSIGTITATDIDGDAITYSIDGGVDAALFAIDAVTGALSFVGAPNFEAPADAGGNNVYDVIVRASDGSFSDARAVAVTVTNTNEGLAFTSGTAFGTTENATAVGTVSATDIDGDAVTYAIAGGADAALFTINASTGAISFVSAPNFEAPGDAGGNNIYDVVISATDGNFSATSTIAVTVGNANEGVSITSTSIFARAENGTSVGTIIASDIDGDAITYSIDGGVDSALFTINATTGELAFINAPNFEAPADAGGNNVYDVIVRASDGSLSDARAVAVVVSNVNEAVSITSAVNFTRTENGTAAGLITATDIDGDAITYSIDGGADSALFTINATTGELAFINAPNFEAPNDTGGNNVYDVIVRASDGSLSDARAVAVTVSNVNEAVTITSGGGGDTAVYATAENSTAVATITAFDLDGTAVSYSIVGGADAARFAINASTGVLSFVAAPNFEAATDAGANNVYDVIVQASDGSLVDTQALAVTVTNVNEAPVITSNGGGDTAAISIAENGTAVTTIASTDPEGAPRSYSIIGGADAARFAINATTGALTFVAAPNYEAPTDAGVNNVYDVIVQASDGSLVDTQALAVTVTNVNEAPVITSNGGGDTAAISIAENGTAVTTLAATDPDGNPRTYSISGGADAARFTINATTGVLTFIAAPNFEAPTDVGANNVYDVIVQASDGTLFDTQALAVTVTNVNEAPVITSNGGGATANITINENTTAVTTVTSTDPEGTARTYAIAGGVDAAKFAINATTGVLTFIAAPNFEAPTDVGANNVYDVIVRASDGTNITTQALAVTIANVVDGSTINGTSVANTLTGTVAEDTINGLGGNDTITGGAGADTLIGGTGADTFVYNLTTDSAVGARDVITDFSRTQLDKISVNPIDANVNLTGNQNFTFIGTAAFSNVAGQLRYEQTGGNTIVTGDVNGDGVADFAIQLTGLIPLTGTDFIL